MQKKSEALPQRGPLKIAVFGSVGVGKSCLMHQLTKWIFPEEYDPTIEDVWKYAFCAKAKISCLARGMGQKSIHSLNNFTI